MASDTQELKSHPHPQLLLNEVEEQRRKLLNVLGMAQCLTIAVRHGGSTDDLPELEGALQLLEDSVQQIVTGLDISSLRKAARS